jgi:hypothetical protein
MYCAIWGGPATESRRRIRPACAIYRRKLLGDNHVGRTGNSLYTWVYELQITPVYVASVACHVAGPCAGDTLPFLSPSIDPPAGSPVPHVCFHPTLSPRRCTIMRRIHRTLLLGGFVAALASTGLAGCSEPTAPTENSSRASFNGMLGAEGRGGGASDTTTVLTTGGTDGPEADGQ